MRRADAATTVALLARRADATAAVALLARRADAAAVVALPGLVLVSQWDLLFGKLWIGMDTATAFYPWYAFLGQQLRAGHIPTWNPYQFAGTPFAADPESGWMYLPAMVLFTVLPLEAAARAHMFVHSALASLSMYALARSLGMGAWGSLVAAVAYTFTGFLAGHSVCCFAYADVAAWLPLMLLGAERAITAAHWRARAAWWGICGLAFSQILAVWVGQGAYYAALVLGSYIAYRTLLAPPSKAAGLRARFTGLLLHGAGVLLFGLTLAAVGLLPRLEYNLISNLPGGYPDADVSLAAASWSSWGFIADWNRLLLEPGFSYVGWTTLGLALAAPLLARRRFAVPYFGLLSVAVLVLARYEPTPLHALLALLPGFERIHARSPERALIVFYLGPALLAGAAVSRLQPGHQRTIDVVVSAAALVLVWTDLHVAWNVQLDLAQAGKAAYQLERADLAQYYAPSGAARFLQSKAETDLFRYFGYAQHFSGAPMPYTLRWMDPSITSLEVNNRALVTHLDDIQGYNPIHIARYDDYLAAVNGQTQNYHHSDVLDSGLNSPLLDLLGVRYIIIPAVAAADQIEPRFNRPFSLVYQDERDRVMENAAAFPRAWMVHSVRQVPSGEAIRTLAAGGLDARATALLEVPAPPLGQPADALDDHVDVLSYAADRISLGTHSTADSLVVLGEVYYPAWHAYVDGQAAPLYVADHVLRGIPVPAGDHTVEVRHESTTLAVGALVSLAGLVALILLCANCRARRIGGSRCNAGAVPQL